jgi:ribose transport system substrate-binding protein
MQASLKVFAPVLLLLLAGLLLAACGETAAPAAGDDDDTLLIGMSQANNAESWRTVMNEQIAAAAAQYPELEVVFADAQQNSAQQVADIEQFLQQEIDLLIVSPNEAAPLTTIVSQVYEQGIPVIVLDRKINGDSFTMWIGADNQLIGKKAGTFVAEWCRSEGRNPCRLIELRGLEGSTPARERGDGFREGIAANPAAQIAASQNADWLQNQAVDLTRAMLEVNPNVDVIYAHNDPMAEGALRALEEMNLDPAEILVVGIDALPTPDGGIQSVLDERLDVTYVYPTGGAEAIDWAMRILTEDADPPKEVILDTEEVVGDNAQDLLANLGGGE